MLTFRSARTTIASASAVAHHARCIPEVYGLPTPFNRRPQKATRAGVIVISTGRPQICRDRTALFSEYNNHNGTEVGDISTSRMFTRSRSFLTCLGLTACITGVAAESAAGAPGFVCHPVQPGDSASAIALRLTQSIRGWTEPGFQIFDPIAARFIPKVRYRRINPGWQVCVVESLLSPPRRSSDRHVSPHPNRQDVPRTVAVPAPASTARAGVPIRWWWLALLAMTPVMAWGTFQTVADRSGAVAQRSKRSPAISSASSNARSSMNLRVNRRCTPRSAFLHVRGRWRCCSRQPAGNDIRTSRIIGATWTTTYTAC